jgi:hypothetical protein
MEAYPLQWPEGWARTAPGKRKNSAYKVTPGRALDDLIEAVQKLGGKLPIVSSNLPTRKDGLPYINAMQTASEDPGVAVYWVRAGKQEVMACDRWSKPWENMRAIYHGISGLRAMERAGATQIMERAFQAFALPSGKNSWRKVLDIEPNFTPSAEVLKKTARGLMARWHPDRTDGDAEKFKEVQQALAEALAEIHTGSGSTEIA